MAQKRLIRSLEKMNQQVSRRESRAVYARSPYQEGLHPILQLHRTSGNRYVAQLIQAKRLTPGGKIIGFQRKPTVGGAYNQHGKKADPAARQIGNAPTKLLALQPQTGKGGNAKPPWISPSSQEPLPGVPAPGYEAPKYLRPWAPISIPPMQDAHIYTEDDREKLRQAMLQREQENRQNVARFLNDYVTAAVQITGAFVAAEMSAAAKAAGQGMFIRLLKFALAETAKALLTGGVGVFARPLGKGAVIALEFLADKGSGIAAHEINKEDDDALASAEIDKREEALNKITSQLGKSTGQFVEEMVLGIGGDEANRAFWLGKARTYDLWRFRVAEPFPAAKREGVRSVVAGVLAGHAHTGECRTRMKCWGLQCACDTYDRHEIIVQLAPADGSANVRRVQINSSSQVLSGELAGASIRMLPTMALYIIVDPAAKDNAAVRLMDACRSPLRAEFDEVTEFVEAYNAERASSPGGAGTSDPFLKGSEVYDKMLIQRMPNGDVTVSSGGLAEAVWLYVWATRDGNLTQLANELVGWQHEEQEKEEAGESRMASPTGLAKLAHWRLGTFRIDGARKLISDFVGNLIPQPPAGAGTKGRPIDPRENRP